jgi:benzoyl-CoA reductase/2-hydroxyglutaryl-CoA dehydratase subunit BcrC/BadD/HgdB
MSGGNEKYCQMWERLGLDLEAHDQLLNVLPSIYQEIYLDQENRPMSMEYFDFVVMEIHGLRIQELQEHKAKGGKVVGAFCVYVPEEIVLAAGGLCVGLCAGAEIGMAEAEKVLPRNLCPLIKSAMGFKLSKICPYFESCDMIVGETTCDGKKKAWEILDEIVPTYVMDLPQMKSEKGRELWLKEVGRFKDEIENLTGQEVTVSSLSGSIELVNQKRQVLQRMSNLRQASPSPISGRDALLVEQVAFYDDIPRFVEKVSALCDELEERVSKGIGVSDSSVPRIMISGTPMVIPNWKLPYIIETSGSVVVCEEACTGQRYFRNLVDESGETVGDLLGNLADRYLKTDCACFTPNTERIDHVLEYAKDYKVEGVVCSTLQFCDPYAVETHKIKNALEKEGIPVLEIETDYGQEDTGQIKTRVEAFVEMLPSKQVV